MWKGEKEGERSRDKGGGIPKKEGSLTSKKMDPNDNKGRRRHISRSESESESENESWIGRRRCSGGSFLEERLRRIQGEEQRGRWLEKELDEWKKKNNFDESSDPTDEEIKMQLKLPPKALPGQQIEFKEPLRQWEVVESKQHPVPGWRKELLPEDEAAKEPPPPPPKVNLSLMDYIKQFEVETPKPANFETKEEISQD